jgi:hypothetical protein
MSRIGKRPIIVPKGVTVTIDGQTVTVKGPKAERSWTLAEEVELTQENGELNLTIRQDNQNYSSSNCNWKNPGVNPTTPSWGYIRANFSKTLAYWHAHRPTLKNFYSLSQKARQLSCSNLGWCAI